MFGRRILILVPHADDEVVGGCATIQHALGAGAEVFALYLTHGCIARDTLWPWQRKNYDAMVARRRDEAEKVAKILAIKPIGWMDRPARFLWRNLPEVYDEIIQAIKENQIDQIWVPAFEGGNPDHDGLNALGAVLRNRVSVLEFAEYNFANGKTHSQEFIHKNGTEIIVPLSKTEQTFKKKCLKLYASEAGNLSYVKSVQESYRPLPDYNYQELPHALPLWYMRYQWVPFCHPRVDFTKPSDVQKAIADFYAKAC